MFWNQVEQHHKRGNAVVSREVEVALPDELSDGERRMLAIGFARELVERYKVAADVAIHAPSREGDERNHHAHIMLSACTVAPDGTLGKKAGELDPLFCQKHRVPNMADRERVRWAELTNIALECAGHSSRVDHRSLEAQGVQRIPGSHMGPAVAGMARRGAPSHIAKRVAQLLDRFAIADVPGPARYVLRNVMLLAAKMRCEYSVPIASHTRITMDACSKNWSISKQVLGEGNELVIQLS